MPQVKGKRTFLDNRHPFYDKYATAWNFFGQSYAGGPEYDKSNIFQHPKEEKADFDKRVERAVRMNFSRQVIDLLNAYLFKKPPTRASGGPSLEAFWKDCDGRGTPIDLAMRSFAIMMQQYGLVYLMVDKPSVTPLSRMDELERGMPYVYAVSPGDVLDIIFDPITGYIMEALIQETVRNVSDLGQSREGDGFVTQYRLWRAFTWELYIYDDQGEPKLIGDGYHGLGRVPLIKMARQSTNDYVAPSQIEDVAYLDRAVYNYRSLFDQILYDQTFSTLIIPVDGIPEEFLKKWGVVLGTKAMIPYKAETKVPPQYISPDASQAETISKAIVDLINQIYRLNNLYGEVGTEKGSVVQAQSGVSQAYDFEKLNGALAVEADCIEDADLEVANLVLMWLGEEPPALPDKLVDYPDSFDLKTLLQDIQEYQLLAGCMISDTFDKILKKNLVDKAMPKLSQAEEITIDDEIDAAPSDEEKAQAAIDMQNEIKASKGGSGGGK